MNQKTLLGILLIAGGVAASYFDYRKVRKVENAKRLEINSNLEKDLKAIKRASLVMEKRLKDPTYRFTGVKQVFEDLEFEIIAAHYE